MSDERQGDLEVAADEPPSEEQEERDAEPRAAPDPAPREEWKPRPIVGNKVAWGLATLSGVLCPIGFVGIDIWPVALVAWIPLIIALRGQPPRRALALGWYAGFVMTMIGFYWLVSMLEVFSGFPLPLCILFAAILCIQKGGRMGLMALLYALAARRGWHHGLSFLGAFAVSELVYPLLFPWYYAASLHQVPVLLQTAELGGPILISLVILSVNVALAELAERPLFGKPIDKRMLVGGLAVPVVALIYGALRIGSVDAASAAAPRVRVGMVQGNMPLKGRSRAIPVHLKRTKELVDQGVDLVVWSEASIARAFSAERYERELQRLARQLKVPAILGAVLYERIDNPDPKGRRARYFNTALITDLEGKVHGRYDKQFLLMFGEYLPFGETFPILYQWSPNSGSFTPGVSFDPLPWGEYRIATMICYEDIIPTFVNELVETGDPHLFVNMTNDAWFGDTAEPWQHLALAQFRSVEHRKYMVRVTNSGVSAIVDPVGRLTVKSGTFTEEALVGDVHMIAGKTVYARIGNAPWWLVTVLVVGACVVRRERIFGSNKTPVS
jgi:apolipoprotein N-acyltransferase